MACTPLTFILSLLRSDLLGSFSDANLGWVCDVSCLLHELYRNPIRPVTTPKRTREYSRSIRTYPSNGFLSWCQAGAIFRQLIRKVAMHVSELQFTASIRFLDRVFILVANASSIYHFKISIRIDNCYNLRVLTVSRHLTLNLFQVLKLAR